MASPSLLHLYSYIGMFLSIHCKQECAGKGNAGRSSVWLNWHTTKPEDIFTDLLSIVLSISDGELLKSTLIIVDTSSSL